MCTSTSAPARPREKTQQWWLRDGDVQSLRATPHTQPWKGAGTRVPKHTMGEESTAVKQDTLASVDASPVSYSHISTQRLQFGGKRKLAGTLNLQPAVQSTNISFKGVDTPTQSRRFVLGSFGPDDNLVDRACNGGFFSPLQGLDALQGLCVRRPSRVELSMTVCQLLDETVYMLLKRHLHMLHALLGWVSG